MANPQLEDGFVGIARQIYEQLMVSQFTECQRRILDLILRLSWGCGKKFAIIPHQRDFEIVGVPEPNIKEHLDWLINANVIVRDNNTYAFNKDYDHWRVSRARKFNPEKLSDLLSLNLDRGNLVNNEVLLEELSKKRSGNLVNNEVLLEELSKKRSGNLVKSEVETSQKAKFSTPELASPKDSIKDILKTVYTVDELNKINTLLTAEKISDEDAQWLGGFSADIIDSGGLDVQNLYRIVRVARGEEQVTATAKRRYLETLARLGIGAKVTV